MHSDNYVEHPHYIRETYICVFNSDYTATGKTWCLDMKNLLHQVNMQQILKTNKLLI